LIEDALFHRPIQRVHDLRHIFALHLASNGVSLQVVGKLLGHTQASSTVRYAHLQGAPLRDAANQFGRIFSAKQSAGEAACVARCIIGHNMPDDIGDHFRLATLELIARYTVGIAVENNRAVGTGTLVLLGGERFILTAAHVVGDSRPEDIRFWMRPSKPMQEKAAADTTNSEIGGFSLGVKLPIIEIWKDPRTDIAALKLDSLFVLPEAVEVYDVRKSHEFINWKDEKLDGLSLVLFGFPVGNSREVAVDGNRSFRFLGCASHLSEYSLDLNNTAWSRLSSQHSKSKDFVFKYHGILDDIGPQGFSGGAVWALGDDPSATIWRPDPILIGVVHHYAPIAGLLIAAKLPTFIEAQIVPPEASSSS
jgi:hypothetical protein